MAYGEVIAPEMGRITFTSDSPRYQFKARLGEASPNITDGYGGWEIIPRPRRRGLVEWKGNDPRGVEIGILFDEFKQNTSVEPDIIQLEKMAGMYHPTEDREPPLVIFHSNGVVPHDYHDNNALQWVITEITWGDADRNEYGNRIRQAATITLWQHDSDHIVNTSAKKYKKPTTKITKSRHKTHRVVKGETLATIAAYELRDYKRWHEIAKKNPKHGKPRRSTKDLKVGEVLKMP